MQNKGLTEIQHNESVVDTHFNDGISHTLFCI